MDPSLYMAAMNGDLIYLQNSEVTSNLQSQLTPCKETVLHLATEFHQTEFAKAAVQVCPSLLWLADSSGDTALHIAAREGHADMVEFFIGYVQSSDIETGEYTHLTRMVNSKKDTALHCAARRGRESCVKLLVEADAEVCSFVNNADESPLYLSVASGFWNNMAEIIKNCASSSASHKGPNGLSALHPTVLLEKIYVLKEIESLVKWRREMIREGDNLGMTPLHYAAYNGKIEAIKLFLEHDSSAIYVLNKDGESALHVAAFNGEVKALEELVNCRPDCYNMVDSRGRTALHAAVLGDQHVVVEFILRTPRFAGLINKGDKDGNTPLHLAAHFKFYKSIEIFSRNTTMCFEILNDEFLTPFDVYTIRTVLGTFAEPHTLAEHVFALYDLKEAKGTMLMHQFAKELLKEMKKKPTDATMEINDSRNKLNKAEQEREDFGEQKGALEVNLLVAMLVATVTFAAGFTVPGGLVSNGEDEGLATLTNKAAFKVFVVFNTLAFSSSIFAVLFHFHTLALEDNLTRIYYKGIATIFTGVSIVAMMLAFCFGTSVVLTKSTGLSVVPFVIPASFVLLYPTTRFMTFLISFRRAIVAMFR